MKKLLAVGLLILLTLHITGCDNDSDNQSNTKTVFTENDFINDPSLIVDIAISTCITFLEPPKSDDNGARLFSINDDGEQGTDLYPIFISTTTNITLCWEDENPNAEHTVSIIDSQGNEMGFHQVNEDCVSELIEPGDYFLLFTHDAKTNEEHTVYMRPANNSSVKRSESFPKFLPNIIKDAFAETDELELLVTTNSCESCNLRPRSCGCL